MVNSLKKIFIFFSVIGLILGAQSFPIMAEESGINMYRMYNPNSGEHFYTANMNERDHLTRLGWNYEGIGWVAPQTSNHPVYRLYNPNAGDHHYTLNAAEKDMLVKKGWNYEGIGWYSDDQQRVPLYRQYNPNARAGAHNFTTSKAENDHLVSVGWRAEGIGWYGIQKGPEQDSSISRLSVSNNRVVDESGNPFVIKGISTHGLAWFPEIVNANSFSNFKNLFGLNTVRLAMYTAEYGGYCTGGNQAQLDALIDQGVNLCKQLDIYCVIDWHILSDGNPLQHVNESKQFFQKMAQKYGALPNVIFEICNEPNGGTSWEQVKQYANEVIPVIRNYSNNLILVGTPNWSQNIDQAANSPLGFNNIAYTLHFYAGTHKDDLRNRYLQNVNRIPIVVSEFGICDASGSGGIDEQSAAQWMKILNENQTGRILWNASNKNETSSILVPGTNMNNWSVQNLSSTGNWLLSQSSGSSINPPAIPVEPAKLSFSLEKTNSWQSGEKKSTQLNGIIHNTGTAPSDGWSFTITFPESTAVAQFWNCKVTTINTQTYRISNVDYNATVNGQETVLDIGMIVESQNDIEPDQIKIDS